MESRDRGPTPTADPGTPPPRSRMLLLGAAGRGAGKTTLACSLLERFRASGPIAAAKVTTVHEEGGSCPRGRDDCGVCSTLVEPFRLGEELGEVQGKDTSRLREAGARPVHWLCARPSALRDGLSALLEAIPADRPLLCESNSLRLVVEPDLFVVLRRAGSDRVKPSCRQVFGLADAVVSFDGERFDPPVESFSLDEAGWELRRPATAIVLAGGQSRRMGRDKTLLPVDGRPMIERVVGQLRPLVSEILVSGNDPERYRFLGLDVVPDREPGQGPMMAVASALPRARHEVCLVVAADLPELPRRLVRRLLRAARGEAEVVVPRDAGGRFEPLVAVYKRSVLPFLDARLAAGERRIVSVYDDVRTAVVEIEPVERLRNVNTPAEYEALERGGSR